MEKIQLRMMSATFNYNPCTAIMSYNSSTIACAEMDIFTFYNELSLADTDCANDLTLLENTPTKPESQLYSLQQAAGDNGFYVNTNLTKFMRFK